MRTNLPEYSQDKILKELKPSLGYKKNLNLVSWKKKIRNKLIKILKIKPRLINKNIKKSNINQYVKDNKVLIKKFAVHTEKNVTVPCYFLTPKKNKKKLPVFICLQGHSDGAVMSIKKEKINKNIFFLIKKIIKKIFNLEKKQKERNFALQAVEKGYAAVAVELRCFGESLRIQNNPTKDYYKSSLYTSSIELILGRTMMGCWVWDIIKVLDVISKFPDVDKNKIFVIGHSTGGSVAFYSSCLDNRIKGTLVSGSFCDFKGKYARIHKHSLSEMLPDQYKYFDMSDLSCLICPKPLIILSGDSDNLFSIKDVRNSFYKVKKIYSTFGYINMCKLVVCKGGHSFYGNIAWPVIKKLTNW